MFCHCRRYPSPGTGKLYYIYASTGNSVVAWWQFQIADGYIPYQDSFMVHEAFGLGLEEQPVAFAGVRHGDWHSVRASGVVLDSGQTTTVLSCGCEGAKVR